MEVPADEASGSTSAGGGAASSCVESGGTCVSLDLPTCGPGRIPVDRACDDTGNRCCGPATGHGLCASAQPIEILGGSITIEDDTSAVADEHPELTCDSPHVAFTFDQGQLYYRFEGIEGRTYQFTLSPTFYGFVYLFQASAGCAAAAIEAACSSEGASGMVSGIVNPQQTGVSSFSPASTQDYVLAVDGDTSAGPFVLTIDDLE